MVTWTRSGPSTHCSYAMGPAAGSADSGLAQRLVHAGRSSHRSTTSAPSSPAPAQFTAVYCLFSIGVQQNKHVSLDNTDVVKIQCKRAPNFSLGVGQ